MIEDTIKQIETRIHSAENIREERRRELLGLLETLRSEVAGLSESDEDRARSIACFAQATTHEATRATQDPRLLDLSVQGLKTSVTGFETSHPRLVQIVNSISQTLSNLGI
jgi:hypothetical protein